MFCSNHFHFQGSWRECLLNSLDIFTFVVNPMLPPGKTFSNILNLTDYLNVQHLRRTTLSPKSGFRRRESIVFTPNTSISVVASTWSPLIRWDNLFFVFIEINQGKLLLLLLENWKRPWLWSLWSLAQLVWDDQTIESHNLLEWVTKVDLSD